MFINNLPKSLAKSLAKSILLIFTLSLSLLFLSGCYDIPVMNDPNYPVNHSYSIYQTRDYSLPYYSYDHDCYYDPYFDDFYTRPLARRNHYKRQRTRYTRYNTHHNYYYDNHYNTPSYHQREGEYRNGVREGERRERNRTRTQQINSDRALANRLQNEEIANARRNAQIASDRALAERLQAQEYANIP